MTIPSFIDAGGYEALERRVAALPEEADPVEFDRAVNRAYAEILAYEACAQLSREQRDALLSLLHHVVALSQESI